MRATSLVAVVLISILLVSAGEQQQDDKFQNAYRLIDSYIAQRMKAEQVPGLSVAITDRQKLLRVSSYGFADVKTKVPITADSLFEIGSISKSFTAVSLLQLRDEGKFDPHQPVTKYLPWLSIHSKYPPITGHDVMSHTAGLPRDRDDVPSSRYQAAGVRDRWTGYAPGKHWAYSNIGFQIMGYLLEEITQQPYAGTVQQGILKPLEMNHTEPVFTHDTYRKLAVGYAPLYDDRPYNPSADPLIEATWQEYGSGDGSIVSTAPDMAAYLRMLLNRGAGQQRRILSEESFRLLTQRAAKIPDEENAYYGYGIETNLVDGHTMVGHSGGMIGYSSRIEGDMDSGIGVVMLMNAPLGASDMTSFALKVLRAAAEGRELPALPNDAPEKLTKPKEFEGTFSNKNGKQLRVSARGNALAMEHDGRTIELQPQGRDSFLVKDTDFAIFPLRFGRENGQVVEAFYGGDWYTNQGYTGPKTFTAPSAWQSYAGHYRAAHPWFNNFRIVTRKGKLWLIEPGGGEASVTPRQGGGFDVADPGLPAREQIFFDTVVHGKTLRATLSGVSYYRTFTP
jgi:D-alanyl-D-alanine carboxypeptidase